MIEKAVFHEFAANGIGETDGKYFDIESTRGSERARMKWADLVAWKCPAFGKNRDCAAARELFANRSQRAQSAST